MSWSDAFREALSRNAARRHRVRTLPPPIGITDPGLDWTITATSDSVGVVIAETGGTTTSALLQVPSWESSLGAWSVDLVGDLTVLKRRAWRGQHVVHEVSLEGGAWEPVQIGVVDDIDDTDTGRGTLRCLDALAALRSRYTTYNREQALFSLYGLVEADQTERTSAQTTLGEAYNPGNESSLTVANIVGVYGDTNTTNGAGRLAVIDPNSPGRFYYFFDGTSGTDTLTGGLDGKYGTTARLRSAGTVIRPVPFVRGHPLDIIRKILCSTGNTSDTPGAANNGTYDTLPRTWGYGIPHWLIDHADIEVWKDRLSPTTGADAWEMISELQQPDGLGYLQGWLARGGLWLTTRQGRYTVRGVVDPSGMADALDTSSLAFGRLSGRWIVPGSLRWSAWGGSGAREYREVRVFTANGNSASESEIRSHPSEWSYPVDLTDMIWSNEARHRALIRARFAPFVLTLCERLEVEVVHPLAKGLAIGDLLLLDFAHVSGRDVATSGNYDGRVAMVCACDPDWWGDRPTKLVLATPPPDWSNQ